MPVYVDSAAGGANDGTSKTDAWTSIASAASVAAGTEVWLDDGHNEALTANITFTNGTRAAPIKLISVDFSDDSYSPGATIAGGTKQFSGSWHSFGVSITSVAAASDDFTFAGIDASVRMEDGVLAYGDKLNFANSGTLDFVNIQVQPGATNGESATCTTDGMRFSMTGGSWELGADDRIINNTSGGDGNLYLFDSVDVSEMGVLVLSLSRGSRAIFRKCKTKASVDLFSGTMPNNAFVLQESSIDGTITIPPQGLNCYEDEWGTVKSTTAVYRTGGADDGFQANEQSWEMASSAGCLEIFNALRAPAITRRTVADGSISGATAQGIFTSTRCGVRSTPAALTTDGTSTWNGSGVGTQQKIAHTLTNGLTLTVYVASGGTLNNDDCWLEIHEPDQVGGVVSVVVCLAKPSTTIYVDPKLEIA